MIPWDQIIPVSASNQRLAGVIPFGKASSIMRHALNFSPQQNKGAILLIVSWNPGEIFSIMVAQEQKWRNENA